MRLRPVTKYNFGNPFNKTNWRFWAESLNPKRWYRIVRSIVNRGRFGVSSSDAWGLDTYLVVVIRNGVTLLRNNSHGYPIGLSEVWLGESSHIEDYYSDNREYKPCDNEVLWGAILTAIIDGCDAYLDVELDLPWLNNAPEDMSEFHDWYDSHKDEFDRHRETQEEKFQLALQLLTENWRHLWD